MNRVIIRGLLGAIVSLSWGYSVATRQVLAADSSPHFYKRVVALCFGIDHYQGTFAPLSTAVRDASQVAQLFKSTFGYEVIAPRQNLNTKDGIIQQIEATAKDLGPNDALIIYIAGHGVSFAAETPNDPVVTERVGFLIPFSHSSWDSAATNPLPRR